MAEYPFDGFACFAHCDLGPGWLLEKRPGNGDAGEHLRAARAAYEEMEMATWLERVGSV